MKSGLDQQSVKASQPVWQSVVEARNFDMIDFVNPDKLLVGTMQIPSVGLHHLIIPGELILCDASTGKPLWKVPRSTFQPFNKQVLLSSEPDILIGCYTNTDLGAIYALDPKSGKIVWQYRTSSSKLLLSPDLGICVLADLRSKEKSLAALRIQDGTEAWRTPLKALNDTQAGEAFVTRISGGILVVCANLSLYSPDNGTLLWQQKLDKQPTFVFETDDNNVLLGVGEKLVRLDEATGARNWEWVDPDHAEIAGVSQADKMIMTVSQQVDPSTISTISALDMKGKRTVWRHYVMHPLQSWLLATDNLVCFTTADRMVFLDQATGGVHSDGPLPLDLHSQSRLPDLLLRNERGILLVRENGIAAYSPSGQLLYSVPIRGGTRYTSDFAWKQYEDAAFSQIEVSRMPTAGTLASTATSSLYAQARSYQLYVYQSTESTMRSGTSSERSAALNRRESAAVNMLSMGQAEANMQMTVAAAQFGTSVGRALAQIGNALLAENTKNMIELESLQAQLTSTLHQRSIEGSFYVRPIYDNGWGLFVIELATGRCCILMLTAPNESLRAGEAPSLFVFTVNPEKTRLYAFGLGFDKTVFKTYEILQDSSVPGNAFMRYTVPYPSLMCFDLTKIPLIEMTSKEHGISPREPTPGELDLIQAAGNNKSEEVKKLLDSGVSANAADRFGKTALMHAAENRNSDSIRLLIDRGADISLLDDIGWTVWDYLTHIFPDDNKKINARAACEIILMDAYKRIQNNK